MVDVGGTGPIPDKELYRQEFNRGLNLFDKSLQAYKKCDESHKKAKFKDVMDKSLVVMNESASKDIKDQVAQLQKDYDEYTQKETPGGLKKLNDDVESLRG